MKKSLSRGFTLIELLVVIAIIGILSSIVLASLNTARQKGSNAAIKGDLNGVRSQAELYYDNNTSSYGTSALGDCAAGLLIFADPNIKQAIAHAVIQNGGTDGTCVSNGTSYAVAVGLKGGGSWCVDSTGVSRDKTAAGVAYTGTTGASPNAITTTSCN